jgi:hypothetical protein
LKMPRALAQHLAGRLPRAVKEATVTWVPEYRTEERSTA